MSKYTRLAEKIYGTLAGFRYELKIYNLEGSEVFDPTEATRFFVVDPPMLVSIDQDNDHITLNISKSAKYRDTKKLQDRIKSISNEFIMRYTVKNFATDFQPRDFADDARKEKIKRLRKGESLNESLDPMYGDKKTSYQDIGNAKIRVIHDSKIDTEKRGARTRNISAIFVEHNDTIIQMPTKKIGPARAMARHLDNGGSPKDTIGEYIIEGAKKLEQLKSFVVYANTNIQLNEDHLNILESVNSSILFLESNLKRLIGKRSYFAVKEKIESTSKQTLEEMDDELSADAIKDKFSVKVFEKSLEDILPTISSIVLERKHRLNVIEEAATKPIYVGDDFELYENGLEFNSKLEKLIYGITKVSRIVESEDLSEYLKEITVCLKNKTPLSSYQTDIIETVMSSIVRGVPEKSEILSECKVLSELEKFFQKF